MDKKRKDYLLQYQADNIKRVAYNVPMGAYKIMRAYADTLPDTSLNGLITRLLCAEIPELQKWYDDRDAEKSAHKPQ